MASEKRLRIKTLVMVLAMVVCANAGDLLLKLGMTEIGEVGVRKRRRRQEIKRLVREFETSGLRRSEFCQKHNLAPGTLQRGLKAPDGSRRTK